MTDLLCPWEPARYLIFSSNIPSILYYALIPGMVISLIFSLYIFLKDTKNPSSRLLLLMSSFFFIWGFLDLILFATNKPNIVMFYWSLVILVEPLIYICAFYLAITFFNKRDISFLVKFILSILILPVVIVLSTKYNLLGVDLNDCIALESQFVIYYTYGLEILLSILIIFFSARKIRGTSDISRKKEIKYFTIGLVLFLLTFSSGNIIGSFTDDWVSSQYGYFGMPIFVGFLGYLIVKFKTFNVKLIATQALIWGLAVFIGSQFFFIRNPINYFLNSITFIAIIIFGILLVRSVKREIRQKEELAKLNLDLKELIKQRESLVHLVTHKVKGSFTRSKYIFAGILDGTFGDINEEVKKRAAQGLESDNTGIETVDLVLNVANMQTGVVKYDMKLMDFKEVVLKTIADKKSQALAKGLVLESNIHDDKNDVYSVMGDAFWLKEAVNNLIDNSIKYTKTGKITVDLRDGGGKIKFSVTDTGIGITDEDKKNLFTQGGRGKDSVRINVDSTGYGLYSVKLIIDAHKGKVWAESEAGKGSQFYIELDAVA